MNLEKLKKPLTVEHIDFKVSMLVQTKSGDVMASILAYKDARVDMNILDESVGPENWQNEYRRDSNGVLQCGIGVRISEVSDYGTNSYWAWKWSNGTPSDFEGEKGEYSDAFKRAGFMWGIGRSLYDFPSIWLYLSEGDWYIDEKTKKPRASAKLRPNDWTWEVSEDYKTVTASRKFGNEWKQIYNSNPYKK